jgi:hypothetical protein
MDNFTFFALFGYDAMSIVRFLPIFVP